MQSGLSLLNVATMFGAVGDSALIAMYSALQKEAHVLFDKYQMAKIRASESSEKTCVIMLECQQAKEAWERCLALVDAASATISECNREQRLGVKEERQGDIGGHAQDHEGVAEDLPQKVCGAKEKEDNWHKDEEKTQATMNMLETAFPLKKEWRHITNPTGWFVSPTVVSRVFIVLS